VLEIPQHRGQNVLSKLPLRHHLALEADYLIKEKF
jgi:hypothetical protein